MNELYNQRDTLVRMALKVHQSKKILNLLDKQSQMRSAEEDKLYADLSRWFNKLQRRVQKLIDEYYEDEQFFLHVNKVYTIVEEMKPEYCAILLSHGLTQFYNARETTTTLYTIQQKKVSTKARLYEPQIIRKEDVGLFRSNPQIEDSLRFNTFQASDKTLSRVTQNISNNLADSYHEGLGIRDAGRKITREFSSLKGWESRRIARTEINTAQNEGAFSAYDELGVEYHMWWTGQDNRVRDSHAPLHGHIVAVGNTFSNGLLYPGDKSGKINEWINCRCTTIPYIIPLGKMAPQGLTEFTEDQLEDIPAYRPMTVEELLDRESPLHYHHDGSLDQLSKIDNNKQKAILENYESIIFEGITEIDFERKGLKNERFIKYSFKDSDITIYKSISNHRITATEVLNFYKSLPPELTSQCKTIVLSNQQIKKTINGVEKYVGGFTKKDSLDVITILNKPGLTKEEIENVLIHELAHTIDGKNYRYSNKDIYEPIFMEDFRSLYDTGIYKGNALYISPYSNHFTNEAINGGRGHNRPYSEDFAECVVAYFKNPKKLFQLFPNKGDYINNIFHKYTKEEIRGE